MKKDPFNPNNYLLINGYSLNPVFTENDEDNEVKSEVKD